ncbi:DEAD/DEAH box helicase [Methylobacterium sp. GXS13]|uniref:DEAD/DEAH box helicase n=1 Tax=Methylobacterium sp. GXS13 TaxID=1730094 RepID=UPI00071B8D5B|nr:DEAD/DEAH box helicase [Methylobacterium sp. GXS13]KST59935.1 DEAD/DEAH box helicase [Methylobacterium sp. GXS13]
MDIFDWDRALIAQYEAFARSFSRIKAPEIAQQVDEAYARGRFWPEPLITINPRYESALTIDQLAAQGVVDPALPTIFAAGSDRIPITLYSHQSRALAKAQAGESFIVTTGTGSGKSLCFFLPIIDAVVRAKRAGEAAATRAIVIYPMNALANSQLEELEKFVGEAGLDPALRPTFARYTGQESDARRKEIAAEKPDILLTNFMMLELLMTRQDGLDQQVIANAAGLRFLVLDELHTYRGRQGADVAMLVRRVKHRLGVGSDLLCIGTSATMSTAADETERNAAVARVGRKLFGVAMSHNAVIGERLTRATDPSLRSETLGAALREAVLVPTPIHADDAALHRNPLAVWIETEIGVEDREGLTRRRPTTLEAAACLLSDHAAVELDQARAALSGMLALMGRPEDRRGGSGDRAFLAFRLHRFISGAGRAYTTLATPASRRVLLDGQKYDPEDETARLYPTFFCRECGQEAHSVSLTAVGEVIPRPIDEVPADTADAAGRRQGFLIPAVNADFPFSGDVADYPEDWQEVTPAGVERLKATRKPHRGELLELGRDGHPAEGGVPAWFFPGRYRFCPCCRHVPAPQARDTNKLASLSAEGRSSATTLLVATLLAEMDADGTIDAEKRKILGFTDNRQDAALQAGHFNDFIFVTLLRAGIVRAVREAGAQGLKPSAFGDAVRTALGFSPDEPARAAEWMANPNPRGYLPRQEAEETLTAVLAHRVWADLRRGWRFTNPNLEEVGLVRVGFPGLAELAHDESLFRGNAQLATAHPTLRQHLFELLFDHMRTGLAVAADALDHARMRQIAEESRDRLAHPWSIDALEQDDLRQAGFLMIDAPRRADRHSAAEDLLIVRAGPRGALGRQLSAKSLWETPLPRAAYDALIRCLLAAAEAHQIVRRVSTGSDAPGWRLAPAALRLYPATGRSDGRAANQFYRALYERTSLMLEQSGALPFSFESREHTAQVDQEVRAWREDRFRYGPKDRERLDERAEAMRDRQGPSFEGKAFLPALFCSPTMELGVDISQLNAVYLRNAPPTPANYAQRAGRAGRSGQAALVVTYCAAQSPHDQYHFADRAGLVAGIVRPPALDIANQDLVRSHLHAEWLAASGVALDPDIPTNLAMDDTGLPLDPERDTALAEADANGAALPGMRALLAATRDAIEGADEIPWLDEAAGFADAVAADARAELSSAFDRWRELYRGALDEQRGADEIQRRAGPRPGERKEALARYRRATQELELLERGRAAAGSDFYTYRYLATEGFLPGYNFPRLPLYASIPATRAAMLQRPRFLAIAEFGPRSLIYHEGRAFRVTRAKLPAHARTDGGSLDVKTLILCADCGAAHRDPRAERCHACDASLTGAEQIDNAFRVDNVEAEPQARISANDEDRQRQGFEILTVFEWPLSGGVPDIRRLEIADKGVPLLQMDYGTGTRLARLNKGLRRRKQTSIAGFAIDPVSGRWTTDANNSDAGDGDVVTAPRSQRIVPVVEDHKNALLLRPQRSFSSAQMATLQHALVRALAVVAELEEGEIVGEPLPSRDVRRAILLYEATEGGAGVLKRLVGEAGFVSLLAREALRLMHYVEPYDGTPPASEEEACVAGCYRCLLSYSNQLDHELIDRQDGDVVAFLQALVNATAPIAQNTTPQSGAVTIITNEVAKATAVDRWLSAIADWSLPRPTSRVVAGTHCPLYWPDHRLLGCPGGVAAEVEAACVDLGIDVLPLPLTPPAELPADLLEYLGPR